MISPKWSDYVLKSFPSCVYKQRYLAFRVDEQCILKKLSLFRFEFPTLNVSATEEEHAELCLRFIEKLHSCYN